MILDEFESETVTWIKNLNFQLQYKFFSLFQRKIVPNTEGVLDFRFFKIKVQCPKFIRFVGYEVLKSCKLLSNFRVSQVQFGSKFRF